MGFYFCENFRKNMEIKTCKNFSKKFDNVQIIYTIRTSFLFFMDAFFLGAVSFIVLLFLSGIVFIGAKKIHFPYTIALVAFGILLGILVNIFP